MYINDVAEYTTTAPPSSVSIQLNWYWDAGGVCSGCSTQLMVGVNGNIAATCLNFGNTFVGTKILTYTTTLTKIGCNRIYAYQDYQNSCFSRKSGSSIVGAIYIGTYRTDHYTIIVVLLFGINSQDILYSPLLYFFFFFLAGGRAILAVVLLVDSSSPTSTPSLLPTLAEGDCFTRVLSIDILRLLPNRVFVLYAVPPTLTLSPTADTMDTCFASVNTVLQSSTLYINDVAEYTTTTSSTSVSITLNYYWDAGGYCPGCITQLMVGINGNIAAMCVSFSNQFVGSQPLTYATTLKTGCNRIYALQEYQYNCISRTSGSNIIGAIFVGT